MMDLRCRTSSRPSRSSRRYAEVLAITAVALFVPRAGHAFCRTTTAPVPANYSPTSGCYAEGLPLFWRNACVGYSLQSAASTAIPLAEATRVIDAAYVAWSEVTCSATGAAVGITASNLGPVDCGEVRYNQAGPNQNVIVFREDRWPYSDPNNTLGLTTVTFNADTGEIYDADMEINASGKNLSTAEDVPANGFDLLSVITHEAGHFLGLAHATDARATMFASYRPGTSALRTLSDDDIDGLCEIYPSTTERRVAESVGTGGVTTASSCNPSPRHGFGAGCESNPAPAEESNGSGGCGITRAPGTRSGALGIAAFLMGMAAVVAGRRRAPRQTPPR